MRRHLLIATTLFATYLALGTEGLSLFRLLAFWPILTLWCAAVIPCVLWWLKAGTRLSFALPSRPFAATEWIMGGGLLSLLVSAVVSGLLCPPNSWDVMVYHLPRQIFWIQQFSVEHFPTHLLLQLYREPFAEFVGTHLLILTGTDYSLSFIQWFALTGCLAAVSLIAEQLGCDRQGQLFASLFVTTIPIIYLEATNAKNDLVFGLWYIILAWLALSVYQERRCRFSTALLIGCALGLLVLTKGAAYLLGLPLLIFTGLAVFRAAGHLAWKPLVVIALTALALNFGHYARNYGLFGSPLGPEEAQEKFLNEAWSPALLLSRLVRESSLQMGTPIEELNRALEGSIEKLHEFLGIDINDPRSTVRLRNFAVLSRFENEYQAPAPLHLALVGLLLILSFAFRRNREPAGGADPMFHPPYRGSQMGTRSEPTTPYPDISPICTFGSSRLFSRTNEKNGIASYSGSSSRNGDNAPLESPVSDRPRPGFPERERTPFHLSTRLTGLL